MKGILTQRYSVLGASSELQYPSLTGEFFGNSILGKGKFMDIEYMNIHFLQITHAPTPWKVFYAFKYT